MAPPRIDLSPYEELITSWRREGLKTQSMLQELHKRGVKISTASLNRYLGTWGLRAHRPNPLKSSGAEALKVTVAQHFHQRFEDKTSTDMLNAAGFNVSVQTVGKIRRSLGLVKRVDTSDPENYDAKLRDTVQYELANGARDYGRRQLYDHMRRKYDFVVSRERVFKIVKELIPEVVAARKHKPPPRLGRKKGDTPVRKPERLGYGSRATRKKRAVATQPLVDPSHGYDAPPEISLDTATSYDEPAGSSALGGDVDFGQDQLDPQLRQWGDMP